MRRGWIAIAALLAGCASAQPPPVCPPTQTQTQTQTPSQTPTPTPTPPPPQVTVSPPPPSPPPPAFTEARAAAAKAIASGDTVTSDKQIDAMFAAAGDDPHLRFVAAHTRATRFAYAGDFERAASAFLDVIPDLAKHPELPDEFWAHNAMMMIREAQGDPAAALAENDQATIAAARGTWETTADREKLAFDKDRWHRAYLTRMLAESRRGSVKQGLVRYAESALDDYRAHGGYPDSIAVLEAYFAALDGKKDAALAAAKKVDPAKDDDVEDLYLVVVGLEAGGDHAGAEAVRKVMRAPGAPHIAQAIMVRWLDLDAKQGKARGFTPRWAAPR